MTEVQIILVKNSWQVLRKTEAVIIGDSFYSKLFMDAPQVQQLFRTDRLEQANKLMNILSIIVNQLHKLDELSPAIEQLAIRHVAYGVLPEHYAIVGRSLLWTLAKVMQDGWSKELEQAWAECYTELANKMILAAEKFVEEHTAA